MLNRIRYYLFEPIMVQSTRLIQIMDLITSLGIASYLLYRAYEIAAR